MVFSNNLLMGAAAAAGAAPAAGWVPKGAIWLDGTADYLSKTPGVAGNRKTWTFSAWVKRSQISESTNNRIFDAGTSSVEYLLFGSGGSAGTDQIEVTGVDGSGSTCLETTSVYRDPSAWMHVVLVIDTANAISSDRANLFVNGRQLTDFDTNTAPSLNDESHVNNTVQHTIGVNGYNTTSQFFNGYMSEIILLDGYAGLPSDFGTEDSNGVWIPKDPTTVVTDNKGTCGFWLDFADSADLGNDVSGNGNDWALQGNLAATNWSYDRPANSGSSTGNFATLDPLDVDAYTAGIGTLSNGNLKHYFASAADTRGAATTISTKSGKWYWEITYTTLKTAYPVVGILKTGTSGTTSNANVAVNNPYSGNFWNFGSLISTGWSAYSSGDVVMFALDQDNGALYVGRDGTWETVSSVVGIPDSGASKTGAVSTDTALSDGTFLCPVVMDSDGSITTCNFGGSTFSYPIGASNDTEGFAALGTQNLPAPTITKPTDNFLPILYEGNGTGQRVGNFIPFTDSKTVDNSCRFDSGGSDYLTKTFTATSSGQTKCTISFWHKRGNDVNELIINAFDGSGGESWLQIGSTSQSYGFRIVNDANIDISTARIIEDTDSWHNYVVEIDTTSAVGVAADKVKIYIDGVRVTEFDSFNSGPTYPALDDPVYFGADDQHNICASQLPGNFVDGYIAEFVFVNGAAHPASVFGETDTSTNRWIPKDITSTLASASDFGTNGFYLEFGTGNALGDDTSGNTNDFTMTNMDTTNGSNQMYDTPTRNYNVMDGTFLGASWGTTLASGLTQGNLKFTRSSGDTMGSAFMGAGSGKWYVEIVMDTVVTSNSNMSFGIVDLNNSIANNNFATGTNSYAYRNYTGTSTSPTTGQKMPRATTVTAGTGYAAGDVLGIAFDLDAGYMWAAKNNTWFDDADGSAGNPTAGTFPLLTGIAPSGPSNPAKWAISLYFNDSHAATFNFGQWRYFDGGATTLDTTADGYFKYTPPTDFLAFQQDNLPENTAGITGLAWIKNLDAEDYHIWFDRARGVYNYLRSSNLYPNTTDAYASQVANANGVQRFLQQGVQVGKMDQVNTVNESFVLWNWANDGAATGISVDQYSAGVPTLASTVRLNDDAKFSIVTYTGDGDSTTKVGHGLGVKPDLIILKGYIRASGTAGWYLYHSSVGATATLWLDLGSAAYTDAGYWANIEPTSEVWSMQANTGMNSSGDSYIAYCWAGVEGYSQFGEYTGNGSNDGPVIYTGFSPNYILLKRSDAVAYWILIDGARKKYNGTSVTPTFASNWDDANNAAGATNIDFLSNGFKLRLGGTSYPTSNLDATPYVYAAFAENPFGGSGVAQGKAK